MSEREGGESRSVGAILLGFLLGVLVTLGGAGSFFLMTQRVEVMRAREAMMQAEAARAEAEQARLLAEKARQAEERARNVEPTVKQSAENEVQHGPEPDEKKANAEEKTEQAQRGIKAIEAALRAYRIKHSNYPISLTALTMPSGNRPALLAKTALIDPWGRAYLYDHGKTRSQTGVPLIYSLGPDPKDENGRIRNW